MTKTSKPPRRLLCALAAILAALLLAPAGAPALSGTVATGPSATAGGAAAPAESSATTVGATRTAPAATTPTTTPPTATAPAGALPSATTPTRTALRPAKSGGELSNPALGAAIIAGLIALACLVWGVFRFGAFEPHWLLSLRHALAEAGFRASATWAEFTDWIRLGH